LKKKIKITYAEGCFDELAEEMTQDELDALTAEIEALVDSGELFEHAEELSEEESRMIMDQLQNIEKNTRQ
jgi:predicted ribosome quality control (RQC) complex YloA/Tae2 family protein